jgi:hypothetical protein
VKPTVTVESMWVVCGVIVESTSVGCGLFVEVGVNSGSTRVPKIRHPPHTSNARQINTKTRITLLGFIYLF